MKTCLLFAVSSAFLMSISQTAWASSEIRLLGRKIDTSTVVAKSKQTGLHADKFSAEAPTRKQGLSSRGTLPYLVQFSGPIREEWKTALKTAGADIKGYVPENAFIVETNPGKLDPISRNGSGAMDRGIPGGLQDPAAAQVACQAIGRRAPRAPAWAMRPRRGRIRRPLALALPL